MVTGSVPRTKDGARKRAEKQLAKLLAKGFEGAELFDSRRAQRLSCCYWTVVAGRFADQGDAKALAKKVKKAGLKAFVKQGWR